MLPRPGPARADDHTRWGPAALREARRGMRLAAELGLPLVTVIDTPGAALSAGGRERRPGRRDRPLPGRPGHARGADAVPDARRGQRRRRARAAARRPGRRRRSTRGSSPLPPEGASAIVHRDTRPRRRDGAGPSGVRAIDLRAPRHRRPDRRREARRGRRAGGVLPPGRRGARRTSWPRCWLRAGLPADRAARYV